MSFTRLFSAVLALVLLSASSVVGSAWPMSANSMTEVSDESRGSEGAPGLGCDKLVESMSREVESGWGPAANPDG